MCHVSKWKKQLLCFSFQSYIQILVRFSLFLYTYIYLLAIIKSFVHSELREISSNHEKSATLNTCLQRTGKLNKLLCSSQTLNMGLGEAEVVSAETRCSNISKMKYFMKQAHVMTRLYTV